MHPRFLLILMYFPMQIHCPRKNVLEIQLPLPRSFLGKKTRQHQRKYLNTSQQTRLVHGWSVCTHRPHSKVVCVLRTKKSLRGVCCVFLWWGGGRWVTWGLTKVVNIWSLGKKHSTTKWFFSRHLWKCPWLGRSRKTFDFGVTFSPWCGQLVEIGGFTIWTKPDKGTGPDNTFEIVKKKRS